MPRPAIIIPGVPACNDNGKIVRDNLRDGDQPGLSAARRNWGRDRVGRCVGAEVQGCAGRRIFHRLRGG